MVDYSRWDKLAADLSDDSNDEREPYVTTFDEPTSVTFGGNVTSPVEEVQAGKISKPTRKFESFIENGSFVAESDTLVYFWNQSRLEVMISLCCDRNTKAKEISVQLDEDQAADGTFVGRNLKVMIESAVLLNKQLYSTVKLDPDDHSLIDWALEDFDTKIPKVHHEQRKVITMTFQKYSAIVNAVIWWKSAFTGDTEIDVSKIKARDQNKMISQQNAWTEALENFKEKKASEKKVTKIDIDE